MAGPNEQKFQQAISGGSGASLRRRAEKWRKQAEALGDVADDIDQAARQLEPVYSGSADAAAAQSSLSTFSSTVRTQQARMLKVAGGLDEAATAMDTAKSASLGPGLPDAKTDATPREQDDYEHQYMVASAARERAAKAAYDSLVSSYAKAGVEMSQAAPEVPASPRNERGGGTPGGGGGGGGDTSIRSYQSSGSALGHQGQAHVEGYSTNTHGTNVNLTPTGETGVGEVGITPSTGTPEVGSTESGSGVLGTGVNAAQATGGSVAGGAGLAGGLALGKSASAMRGAMGGGRAAATPAKPVKLGQSSRSGARGVLGKATPSSARGASAAGAAKTGGTGARGASPAGSRGGQSGATSRGAGAGGTRGAGANSAARGAGANSAARGSSAKGAGGGTKGTSSAPGRSSTGKATGAGAAGRGAAGPGAGAQGRPAGGSAAGRGARNRTRDEATDIDHIAFEDEQAWLEDGETNPGVIR